MGLKMRTQQGRNPAQLLSTRLGKQCHFRHPPTPPTHTPEHHGAVGTGGGEPLASRRDCQRVHPAIVADKRVQRLTGASVPRPRRVREAHRQLGVLHEKRNGTYLQRSNTLREFRLLIKKANGLAKQATAERKAKLSRSPRRSGFTTCDTPMHPVSSARRIPSRRCPTDSDTRTSP